jgi:hypothetical protein
MRKRTDNKKTILGYALEYDRLGLCLIPIKPGTKKPALKSWKRYQSERPSESQLGKWFAKNNRNIAVVLGPVSGDLACRDFDTMAEYERWKQGHPNLAEKLPTDRTADGMHVYFQALIEGIRHVDNGELRESGGYCLLPPSVHPEGPTYEWVNPISNGNLLAVDPELAGFLPETTNVTERTEENGGELRRTEEIGVRGKIEKAIIRTLPRRFRTRHRRIFDFARELYSMPEYTDADPMQFYSVVKEWHKRALPNIRTKEFEETWIDFLRGWDKIKYKIEEKPMAEIFEGTIQLEPPEIAVEKYPDHSKLKILASLCRELQRAAGESPFFLSVRTAGKLLDVSPMQVSRWFFLLETDGILKVIAKGKMTAEGGVATRFRYTAN